jgi:hypothetical protein
MITFLFSLSHLHVPRWLSTCSWFHHPDGQAGKVHEQFFSRFVMLEHS